MSDREGSRHSNQRASVYDQTVQVDRVCWEDISKDGLLGTRLLAKLRFNGVNHHLYVIARVLDFLDRQI